MVIEFIVSVVVQALGDMLGGVLPVIDPPDFDLTGVVHYYAFVNSFLPVGESLELIVLALQVLGVLAAFWVLMFFVRKIPILGIK